MISRKYAKDFDVEYDQTPSGRLKARAVYKGKLYVFSDTDEKKRNTAVYFTILLAAAWIAFFMPLGVLSAAARTSYVILPHVCVFLPMIGMSAVVYDLWTAKPPLTREESDHISHRAPKSALFMTVFSGIAAAGLVIRLCAGQNVAIPGDLIFFVCEAVLLAASILLFMNRRRTATRETL